MNQQKNEAVGADVFAPGNIVQLREPYKPDGMDRAWTGKRAEWRAWPGYTHGIVAEVLDRDRTGRVRRVSLHLYDPERALLYLHDNGCAIPVYVDHHVDELKAYKVASDDGYAALLDLG